MLAFGSSWSERVALGSLLLGVAGACGGKSVELVLEPAASGSVAGSAGAARGGMSAIAGSNAGGPLTAGEGGSAGTALGGALTCRSSADCGSSSNACQYAACVQGACTLANVARGALVARDTPADCADTLCDGLGGTTRAPDLDNAPEAALCFSSSCDASGNSKSAPLPAGADCSGDGGRMCDGAGRCVACLGDSDCPLGQVCGGVGSCNAPASSCADGKKNGAETDVDCGGSCPPCAVTKDCSADKDCVSQACDANFPYRCLASHCDDHRLDGDETATDCGGSCAPCGDLEACKVNADCQSGDCDPKRGSECLPKACFNGQLDGLESDVDCGGGICDLCPLGEGCGNELDCVTLACDGITRRCVADHCTDHAWDGDETYLDCGGPTCKPCGKNQLCDLNRDCAPGLTCQGEICQ